MRAKLCAVLIASIMVVMLSPASGQPQPGSPWPLSLHVNKTQFTVTDTIAIDAELRIVGTQWAGMYCWPYVRVVAYGQVPLYLVRGKEFIPISPKPYLTGKKGAPLRFYEDISSYPLLASSFQNIPPGIYYIQAAMVRAVKYKKEWYPTTVMGEMVNIPLIVQPASEAEIAALFDRWNQSLQTGDPSKVTANYAERSILLPTLSNKPRLTPAEKEDYFRHFLEKRPSGRIDFRQITIGCTMAVDSGLYTFTFAKTGELVKARYSFTYQWDGSQWLIVSHHSSVMPETN